MPSSVVCAGLALEAPYHPPSNPNPNHTPHTPHPNPPPQGLVLGEELRCRQRLLRRLGYLEGEEGLISVKGRLAADLTTGDELVLAELVFGGTFASLDLEQLAALCSCFVGAERTDKGAKWVAAGGGLCVGLMVRVAHPLHCHAYYVWDNRIQV